MFLQRIRKNNGKRGNKGFTLVELVAVIVIVSIISIFAIGQLGFTSTVVQKGVYDKLRAGIQYAGKAAVAQRRYVCVCIGTGCATTNSATFTIDWRVPETTGVTFCDGSSVNNLLLPTPDKDCGGAANAVCSRSGATIGASSGISNFQFNPQGQALNSAGVPTTVGITLTGLNNISCAGSSAAVCVVGQTGFVQ